MYDEESVALIIRPLTDLTGTLVDNWIGSNSPFINDQLLPGQGGYIFANTDKTTVDFDDYKLMPARLVASGVGSLLNKIDFMQKTTSETRGENISNGLGGLAKLKDFWFSLVENNDLVYAGIYGRKVEVRIYNGSELSNDIDAEFTTYYLGIVYKIDNPDTNTIKITCQGTIRNNNPRIHGTPYVDSSGNIQNNIIIIGDTTEDTLIKLNKINGPEGIMLGYDNTQYELQEVFVKDQQTDEFFKVTQEWYASFGFVYFASSRKLKLNADILSSSSLIPVNDGIYISIEYTTVGLPTYVDYLWIQLDKYKLECRLTSWDENVGHYRVSDSYSQNLTAQTALESISKLDPPVKLTFMRLYWSATDDFSTAAEFLPEQYTSIGVKEYEKIDINGKLTPNIFFYKEDKSLASDDNKDIGEFDYWERGEDIVSPLMNSSALQPYKNKARFIVQIGDEKVLVLRKQSNYSGSFLFCIRGYAGTTAAAHTKDDIVQIMNTESTQAPLVIIQKDIDTILYDANFLGSSDEVDAYRIWESKFTNENVSPLEPYLWRVEFGRHTDSNYLHFSLTLPNLNCELTNKPSWFKHKIELNDSKLQINGDKHAGLGVTLMTTTKSNAQEEFVGQGINSLGDWATINMASRSLFGYNKDFLRPSVSNMHYPWNEANEYAVLSGFDISTGTDDGLAFNRFAGMCLKSWGIKEYV